MPQYLNSHGQTVSASEATFDGKRTRPGYSAIVADGERVRMQPGELLGFNIDMIDNRPSASSVFLTDTRTELADVLIAADVARQRMVHDQRFAFMGDKAPAFDDGSAKLIAAARVNAGNAAVRDAAREFAASDPGVEAARGSMIADLHSTGRTPEDSNASMRDAAREASYG